MAVQGQAAARQIPAERENRTIFPLLAKPVTRGQVIAWKFLGCWLAAGIGFAGVLIVVGPKLSATLFTVAAMRTIHPRAE